MTDLLLIQPPIEDFYDTRVRAEPMGLMSLASVLLRSGISAALLDSRGRGGQRTVPAPAVLREAASYSVPGDRSPFRLWGAYRRFGLEDERMWAGITPPLSRKIRSQGAAWTLWCAARGNRSSPALWSV
ncbi:MAG: hypothetical protein HY788_18710 [Deltaproteobacteria bacterium]|nr:hypothetical protein [Deltaproteobacteria bacterium]